jgi:hypothetical protein
MIRLQPGTMSVRVRCEQEERFGCSWYLVGRAKVLSSRKRKKLGYMEVPDW